MSLQGHQLEISSDPYPNRRFLFEDYISDENDGFISFRWVKKERCRATLSVVLRPDAKVVSLPNAPFGGLELMEELNSEVLDKFLDGVLENLKGRGVRQIELIQAPKPYEERADLIGYLLHKKGFEVANILNHQFFLGRKKIKVWVKEKAQKIIKKAKNQGIRSYSNPISNFDFLNKIAQWNQSRGYDENLNQTQIIQQVSLFPDRYFEISITQDDRVVGSALAVRLTEDSIYYYKSAIDPDSKIKNGGDVLLAQLFFLAAELKVNFIDLGSSDMVTSANHQLIFFKSRFSNDQFNKVTWSKDL